MSTNNTVLCNLMHGHISNPVISCCVNGQTMWHVEPADNKYCKFTNWQKGCMPPYFCALVFEQLSQLLEGM